MINIFLFGYYGFQNIGDEAILQAIVKQSAKALPDAMFTALTYKAKDTIEKYGIQVVSRNKFKNVLKAIKESDIVISGGGSVMQDVTSSRSLIYYLAIIWYAKRLGKKVMFYGNGFGPINRFINKRLSTHIINQVDIITVRDCQSKEAMRSIGIKKDIMVTADAAFALDSLPDEKIDKICEEENLSFQNKSIGISVREWKGQKQFKEIIAKTADNLIKKNYEVIFIPMQYPDDMNLSKEIAEMMEEKPKIIEKKHTPEETMGIISKLDLLIGMRLHSLIFAAIAQVPMIGLEYEAKITGFLKTIEQKSGGRAEDLDIVQLWTTIEDVLINRDEHIKNLSGKKQQLHKKALENVEIFKEFVLKGEKK